MSGSDIGIYNLISSYVKRKSGNSRNVTMLPFGTNPKVYDIEISQYLEDGELLVIKIDFSGYVKSSSFFITTRGVLNVDMNGVKRLRFRDIDDIILLHPRTNDMNVLGMKLISRNNNDDLMVHSGDRAAFNVVWAVMVNRIKSANREVSDS
jgi:hypothetical protein